MVAKRKARTSIGANKGSKKLRLGVLVGKDFDPVKKDTQPPNFPKKLIRTNDDWGKYSVDAVTAVRMQGLHPDVLDIDIIPGEQVTEKRLQKNHVNLTFWPEVGTAILTGKKKFIDLYWKVWKNPSSRLDFTGDYYLWVMNKTGYMTSLKKAGIPTIPTIMYKNGFDTKKCLKDVQAKGWDKFLCKLGSFSMFGMGSINGKTEDFLGKRAKDLEKFQKETAKSKIFLLQPYMLKPNGHVFDEVRNFFIDGDWRYSVFTHGTDESDAGYYQEPDGPRKEATKALAIRAYQEVLKNSTWHGKRQTPLVNRIDIGVMPKKGGDSLHKTDNVYFVNEIEPICTTWLDRYAPINVADTVAHAGIKHAMELLAGLLNAKKGGVPDQAACKQVLEILSKRLGYKHIKVKK